MTESGPFLPPRQGSYSVVFQAQDERRSRIEQIRENSARTAIVNARFRTFGTGSMVIDELMEFGLGFLDPPAAAYSFSLPDEPELDATPAGANSTEAGLEAVPDCSAGIWRWEVDRDGFYIGAYPMVVVTCDVDYELEHYFTFHGTARKAIPEGTVDELLAVAPPTTSPGTLPPGARRGIT